LSKILKNIIYPKKGGSRREEKIGGAGEKQSKERLEKEGEGKEHRDIRKQRE